MRSIPFDLQTKTVFFLFLHTKKTVNAHVRTSVGSLFLFLYILEDLFFFVAF
jgi:hypothetical protein